MKTISVSLIPMLFINSLFAQVKMPQKSAGITLSFPWVNNYSYFDYETRKSASKTAYTGIGIAVFYQRGKNKISLNCARTSDLPTPLFLPIEYVSESPHKSIGCFLAEAILHHRVFKRLNGIVGLNLTSYHFDLISSVSSRPSYSENESAVGLTVGSEYLFSSHFSVALLYRPGIYPSGKNIYRHILSVDFRFDIKFFND